MASRGESRECTGCPQWRNTASTAGLRNAALLTARAERKSTTSRSKLWGKSLGRQKIKFRYVSPR